MKKRELVNKSVALLTALSLSVSVLAGFASAKGKDTEVITTGEIGVLEDKEFGFTYLEPSIEEFNNMGFVFGDSLTFEFDNGLVLEDVPYYSGYYVPVGGLLLVGYPGYPHPSLGWNFGNSSWVELGMTEDTKVTVTLNERGKYAETERVSKLEYSDDRLQYETDEEFANFREIIGGNIKEGRFYRSASPCDNQHLRAAFANALAEAAKVGFFINLSDTQAKYDAHISADDFTSYYYDSLYRDGKVLILGLNANYRSDAFAEALSQAFLTMSENDAPCLIHCVEGKDRTGFACALLLALAGASADEILEDYMITYDNYYGINKADKPEQYAAISDKALDFFYCWCDAPEGTDVETLDLKAGAENYLRRGGLTDDEIARIEAFITK